MSPKKDQLEFSFYYPCFICNSPFQRDEQALILLHNHKKLKETQFEHFYSMFVYRSDSEFLYKTVDFEIMGSNYELWAGQFKNDLENLFINQGLQLIGGFSKPGKQNEFKFVMYNTCKHFNITFKFDLEIDTLYGYISPKEFEDYLNTKYKFEKLVFVSVFTIYRSERLKDVIEDAKSIMHLIIFQDMKINFDEYSEPFTFVVKSFPLIASKIDKEFALLNAIEHEQKKNKLEFLGVLPGYDLADSLLVYANHVPADSEEISIL